MSNSVCGGGGGAYQYVLLVYDICVALMAVDFIMIDGYIYAELNIHLKHVERKSVFELLLRKDYSVELYIQYEPVNDTE